MKIPEASVYCKKCKKGMRTVAWSEFDGHIYYCETCKRFDYQITKERLLCQKGKQ